MKHLHIKAYNRVLSFDWIPPCRARWLLHKPTVTQAHSMLCETPATPCAGMTEFENDILQSLFYAH